jgi:hypothetical protein
MGNTHDMLSDDTKCQDCADGESQSLLFAMRLTGNEYLQNFHLQQYPIHMG